MEFKEAMRYIIKTDFELYSKLLALYHLRQSFYIILKSKNEEIISSRIEFAKERLGDLKSMNISKDEFVKIVLPSVLIVLSFGKKNKYA